MALSDDVRKRLRELEQEEKKEEKRHLKKLQQLKAEFKAENAQVYQQMKQLLQERETAIHEEFNDQMLKLRQQADDQVQQYLQQQQALEESKRKEREKALEKIRKEREILENRVNDIEAHLADKSSREKQRAKEMLDELSQIEEKAALSPHQVFFGNQFDIIRNGWDNIERFMRDEMYQAASGQAALMMADYELLEAKTDQKYREWEVLYQRFSTLLQTIWMQVNMFNQSRFATPFAQKIFMSDTEKNFWSQGDYSWMMQYLDQANNLESQIGIEGIEQYLKGQTAIDVDQLTDLYYDLREERNHIYAILNCINNERYYSDQRYVWGEQIAKVMEDLDYDLTEIYWEEASSFMQKQQWYQESHQNSDEYAENQLGTYFMTFEFGNHDCFFVKIVPIRENGICVRNQCYLTIDMNSSKNAHSMQNILASNGQRISSAIGANAVSFVENISDYDIVERSVKKASSITEQQKYLNLVSGRRD